MPTPPTDAMAAGTPGPSRRRVLAAMAAALPASGLLALGDGPAYAAPAAKALPGGGDLGPNVLVFDSSTPNIQGKLDEIFKQQESAQFGTGRYALLFKPGTYNGLNAQLGFYTSISGLGLSPDDTAFNGDVTVDAGWFNGNATQNFWRSAENLALTPVNGTNRWAVAQAAPFRRMHVKGGLNLAPDGYGWASGGYIADSRIDGAVGPYSQQQWYTRDSSVGSWSNAVWNMVFSGVEGAPGAELPGPAVHDARHHSGLPREALPLPGRQATTRSSCRRSAPTPAAPPGATGPQQGNPCRSTSSTWPSPASTRRLSTPPWRRACTCCSRPGIYHVDQPHRRDSVRTPWSSGLGYATLIPDNGVTAMKVADVDGVRLAGFLIDAGTGQLRDPVGGRPGGRFRETTPPTRPPSRTCSSASAARARARRPPAW